ncbi:MAG: SDR family NAD(P)-dependent oxidoreductase [Actinomycetota bacterium]
MSEYAFPGFEGKVAVVTGAARGIGRGLAEGLAAQGAKVGLLDISWEGVEAPENPALLPIECDIADEDSVDAAIAQIEEAFGAPSILVNNAAILPIAGLVDTTPEVWRRTLDVNITGAFLCTRRVVPAMREAKYGRIINIGSNSGKMGGTAPVTAYAATKAALHNLARSVATEFAKDGITANAVAACLIDTGMATDAGLEKYVERIPVGRIGTVDDVVYATLFLASTAAGYITAEVMDVNGGFYID